jgi:hypothetical protein
MDQSRIEQIKQRVEAATPGPWRTGPINYADIYGADDLVALCVKDRTATVDDAQFIAHARQDIPDLLAALAEAQEELSRLRADAKWRDIASAPRDGTVFQVYTPQAPLKVRSRWWSDIAQGWSDDAKATHWMPLPAPPADAAMAAELDLKALREHFEYKAKHSPRDRYILRQIERVEACLCKPCDGETLCWCRDKKDLRSDLLALQKEVLGAILK